jgi:hypothetical protein
VAGLDRQGVEQGGDLVGGDHRAENLGHAGSTQLDHAVLGQRGALDQFAGGEFTAGDLADELHRAAGGVVDAAGVDAALEAEGGVGADVQAAAGVADGDRVPGGHLEDDIGGGGVDLAVVAADDAGEGLRALGVRDDEVGVAEGVLAGVEGLDLLAGGGEADDESSAGEFLVVEHMAGVAQFEGDVVGDIDNIVDGALADGFEGSAEPVGAGADLDAADEPGGEERAAVGDAVVQVQVVAQGPAGAGQVDGGEAEGAGGLGVAGGGDLAGDADMAEAVAAVAGHLDIDDGVAVGPGGVGLDGQAGLGEDGVGLIGRDIAGGEVLVEPTDGAVHGTRG